MINLATIGDFLHAASRECPSKPFLLYGDRKLTYEELYDQSRRVAEALWHSGIRKGDVMALMLPNSPEFLCCWLGAASMGSVTTPLNPALTPREIHHMLHHSGAKILIADSQVLPEITPIFSELPGLRHIVQIGKSASTDFVPFAEWLQSSRTSRAPTDVRPEDPAVILYTSGTTGHPKAVLQPHRTFVLTGEAFPRWLQLTSEDRLFTCLPLTHINAQAYSVMGAIGARASLALEAKFTASRFWEVVARYRATEFNFIGAMLMILRRRPFSSWEKKHIVRFAYGAPSLPEDVRTKLEARFGLRILIGYGLTESTFGTIEPLYGPRKPGSIGVPRQHPASENKVRIVDDVDREVPVGVVGEIVLRNRAIMLGYLHDPAETAKALRGGWLHTGDLGYLDEDGFLFFMGRKKEIIRRRGENISPVEVEAVLNQHPNVLESAVVPVPSELTEEEVKAYVVLRPGAQVAAKELFRWCEEKLADFKVPRYLEFRLSLPKTSTLRIPKHLLRQEPLDLTQCVDREAIRRR